MLDLIVNWERILSFLIYVSLGIIVTNIVKSRQNSVRLAKAAKAAEYMQSRFHALGETMKQRRAERAAESKRATYTIPLENNKNRRISEGFSLKAFENESLKDQLAMVNSELARRKSELERITAKMEDVKSDNKQLRVNLSAVNAELARQVFEMERITPKVDDVTSENTNLKRRLAELNRKRDFDLAHHASEMKNMTADVENAASQIIRLQNIIHENTENFEIEKATLKERHRVEMENREKILQSGIAKLKARCQIWGDRIRKENISESRSGSRPAHPLSNIHS